MDYDLIFAALWFIWLAYWIFYWRGNKPTVKESNLSGRLWLFLFFIGLYVGLYKHDGQLSRQILPHTEAMQALGSALCATGIGISIWARRVLGKNWSANPAVMDGHELIVSGPYRYVRHPIYTGLLLALFGTEVVASGKLRDFIFFGAIAIAMHFKSRIEERFMQQTFPQAYPEYRRRTKAIIPFVL